MLVNTRLWVGLLFVASVFILPGSVSAQIPGSFSTVWDTTQDGNSDAGSITFPFTSQAGNLEAYWEEVSDPSNNGTTSLGIFGSNDISFGADGTYRVDVVGYFPNNTFVANSTGDESKLISVEQWGSGAPPTFAEMFHGADNLVSVPSVEAPDTSVATDMSQMFELAASFNSPIDHWNVENITDMNSMFSNALAFNQPLNSWNVSNVVVFDSMFNSSAFNQPLDGWTINTSAPVDMSAMFSITPDFNQSLDNWDVSTVTEMDYMFYLSEDFNQPLNNWDTSSVESMECMFCYSLSFNQPLNNWDTSNVTNMANMFEEVTVFDQTLGDWNVSSVSDMTSILTGTAISVANYSSTLSGWAAQDPFLQPGISLGSVGDTSLPGNLTQYYSTAQDARDYLTVSSAGPSWTITDGGSIDAFELVYGSTVNATLSGEAIQTVASGTSGTAIEVVPNQGFEFVQWSDGNTDNPRTDTPTTASVSVIAEVSQVESTSSGTRVGTRKSSFTNVEEKDISEGESNSDRTTVTSEGIAILNLSPEELKDLPDQQKKEVIDILLALIAILTEILTQMMAGEEGV